MKNKENKMQKSTFETEFNLLKSDLLACAVGEEIRCERKFAKKMLLENTSLTCGGKVFHIYIRNLGMGICGISKAPLHVANTKMIKGNPKI